MAGTLASVVYLIVPMLGLARGMDESYAILLGVTSAAIVSYTAHVRYTFKVESNLRTLIKYLMLLISNYLFFVWMTTNVSKVYEDPYFQIFLAGMLSIGVSFILNSLFVFRTINLVGRLERWKYGS